MKNTTKKILNLISEWGHLKMIKHEGWRLAGVEHPDSVAEHSLRAAQIGYILAKLENFKDPNLVCTMLVFHDIGECRVGDIHKVANRYLKVDEERAVIDQLEKIKEADEILNMWKDTETQKTTAGIIAKDADLLEQAFMAKEYLEKGYDSANDWIKRISTRLKTKSAIELIKNLKNHNSKEWWQGLKVMHGGKLK